MDIHFEDKEKFLVDENNDLRKRLDVYEAMLAILIQKMGNEVVVTDMEIEKTVNLKTQVVQIEGFHSHSIVLSTSIGRKTYWEPFLKEK